MRDIQTIFKDTKTIAVVGLSPTPGRDSHEVAKYLQQQGYRIIPVNPTAQTVLGERCYPDLKSVPDNVDMVDVFRRPEETVAIARDAVAIGAKTLWLQIGIVNEEAALTAAQGGLDVVMDRCTMVEHQRLKAQRRL